LKHAWDEFLHSLPRGPLAKRAQRPFLG